VRHFVIGVDHEDGIQGAIGKQRVIRLTVYHLHVGETLCLEPVAQPAQARLVDVHGIHPAGASHLAGEPHCEIAAARTDVGDVTSRADGQGGEHVGYPLPCVAGRISLRRETGGNPRCCYQNRECDARHIRCPAAPIG
jgi:hypothetical protein